MFEKIDNYEPFKNNYEMVLKRTDDELQSFKDKQVNLKREVLKVLEENEKINSELKKIQFQENDEQRNEYKKLTDDAIANLKGQIRKLTDERDMLHTLWKTCQETIHNLEGEIEHYRSQLLKPSSLLEIKKRYIHTINLLENNVTSLREELEKQSNISKELVQHKNVIQIRLKAAELRNEEQENKLLEFKNMETSVNTIKNEIKFLTRTKSDLEITLKAAKNMINDRLLREKEALQKVQEALSITESAIGERDVAIAKEKAVREEFDNLAATIGQVMEEAALKVEKNIEHLKLQHTTQMEDMENALRNAKKLLDEQIEKTNLAEIRIQKLEDRLKITIGANEKLDTDLQIASKAIIELELKLETVEILIDKDKKANKIGEEKEHKIETFLINNNQMKERWKNTVQEVTTKLQQEVIHLQNENTTLKLENQQLKLKYIQK